MFSHEQLPTIGHFIGFYFITTTLALGPSRFTDLNDATFLRHPIDAIPTVGRFPANIRPLFI
jgi:hypothetical protein